MDAIQKTATHLRADSAVRQPVRRSLPREGLWIGLVMALATCLPVFVAVHPQLTDYPAHLARYHVMLEIGRNADLARFYTFAWQWTGNLGVDLLMRLFAPLFGLEAAGRAIVAAIPVLTGLAILTVEWTLRRRIGAGALFAFTFIWSPTLLMGLSNFGLSLALALFAFALWVRLAEWRWRAALFVPIGVVVWLCHVSGWGILGIIVFGYEWHRRKGLRAFVAPWPLMLPFLSPLLASKVAGGISWGANVQVYKIGILLQTMRDRNYDLDMVSLIVVLLLLAAAVWARRFDGRLGWGALIVFVGALLMPRHIFGGDYADYRMISSALMLAFLAVDCPAPRWALWCAPLLFAVRLTVTTQAWHDESRQLEHMLRALDHVPQGARVASGIGLVRGGWRINPFEHVCGYAVVRRDALSNCNFALPGVHMLGLRQAGFTDPSQRIFLRRGQAADLAAFAPARGMDYLWYVGRPPVSRLPAGARVVYRAPGTLLARLAKPAP